MATDSLDVLTSAERRFLVETRRRLHQLDPWTRGHFAECLVADLIGAKLAAHTVSPHDLEWDIRTPPVTIAVRATGGYSLGRDTTREPAPGTWHFGRPTQAWDAEHEDWAQRDDGAPIAYRCHAEVAVLCHHHGLDITKAWTFHVLPQDAIETWPAQSLRPTTVIAAGYPALDGHQIAEAIRAITG